MAKTIEELQADLEAALASIKKLEDKNKELQTEKQKAKSDADAEREAREAAEAERERESKDIAAIEKRLTEKHTKELQKLQADLTARDQQLQTLLIDNTITANLAKNNVAPAYQKALMAMLKAEAKLDGGEAKIGDVTLEEHISSYLSSDEGKAFVQAPANSGTGATGTNKTAVVTGMPDAWNFSKYAEMKGNDPELANSYAKKFNQPFAK